MTWEETIRFIRTQPDYQELIEKAYLDEDLPLNVERFRRSEEFQETICILRTLAPGAEALLDIGSGNGISAIAFALEGYEVTVSEPDASDTVGAGAIRKLKSHYQIARLDIHEKFAEEIQFNGKLFDVVYIRQAMHHAYDLNQFLDNLSKLIKPNGYLFTVRDHVVFDDADKHWFLDTHPLHSYYGGENAFTLEQYKFAMQNAGLVIRKIYRHFDSVINYFPLTQKQFKEIPHQKEKQLEDYLSSKIGLFGKIPLVKRMYKKRVGFTVSSVFDERKVPGRMYSFIAQKK